MKSRIIKLGLPISVLIIGVIVGLLIFDGGSCSATEQFTIDYKVFNSEEYKNSEVYNKEGVSLSGFILYRGNCTNPNTFIWNNLTDRDVTFSADFITQDEDYTIKPNNSYSYTFHDIGEYIYRIGETEDSIAIK
ncbi:MAG: hypothetical protein V1853_00925 [bacterium]